MMVKMQELLLQLGETHNPSQVSSWAARGLRWSDDTGHRKNFQSVAIEIHVKASLQV